MSEEKHGIDAETRTAIMESIMYRTGETDSEDDQEQEEPVPSQEEWLEGPEKGQGEEEQQAIGGLGEAEAEY
jgi:hypothetical protein